MSIIEKNIVNFLNQEFQGKFQELFSMLIDGGEITVEVDETFTPVIKENGMDINLSSLSGGERTSVAMAYRLALNRTVQMESTGMEESAIILDEPTDGFSTEQIERFGELLKALACSQVILVSHEQELLSCADNVIRIKRRTGSAESCDGSFDDRHRNPCIFTDYDPAQKIIAWPRNPCTLCQLP